MGLLGKLVLVLIYELLYFSNDSTIFSRLKQ
jgi:hypothetical protein